MKLADKWDSDHPDEKSANPYRDAADRAAASLNGQSSAPQNIDDYNSVYSFAQNVLEENYRRNYPASADDLYQAISSVGGFGPQVAEDLKQSGALDKYGK